MSGHSKWSKVKHQKATTDAVKGAAFTKASHAITIAVKEGGGVTDPDHNFRLRLAIEKAKAVNMPKDTILRAIERGAGVGGSSLEQVVYEAFGPGGVGILVEAATDNRQRTVSAVKHALARAGGLLATPGAVSCQFESLGVVTAASSSRSYDEMLEAALEAGADDVVETGDMYEIYAPAHRISTVKRRLEEKGIAIDNVELIMRPKVSVPLDEESYALVETLAGNLETLDDVQHVYTNAQRA